ncbi:MAG: DUF3387 domain-containing protein [Thermoleophilia bacterium]|nr:DUF3387 domain-containing protein [Thermoleophilia bacterium]
MLTWVSGSSALVMLYVLRAKRGDLGDDILAPLAREPARELRENVTVDWQLRENERARLRVPVKRVLRRHKFAAASIDKVAELVLEQAQALSADWLGTVNP